MTTRETDSRCSIKSDQTDDNKRLLAKYEFFH